MALKQFVDRIVGHKSAMLDGIVQAVTTSGTISYAKVFVPTQNQTYPYVRISGTVPVVNERVVLSRRGGQWFAESIN